MISFWGRYDWLVSLVFSKSLNFHFIKDLLILNPIRVKCRSIVLLLFFIVIVKIDRFLDFLKEGALVLVCQNKARSNFFRRLV